MSSLKLYGSTSGYVEVAPEATAQNNSITIPNTAGTIAVKDASGNLEVGTGVTIAAPSSNTYTVSTNGSERVRVDSSGNVGIGTDNPTKKLEIFTDSAVGYSTLPGNTATSNALLRLYNKNGTDSTGVDNYVGIQFDVASGATSSAYLSYVRTGDNAGAFAFKARNASSSYPEIARFRSAGGLAFNGDTADANALDDYEEGTWTPVFGASTTDPVYGTSVDPYGRYTRVGNQVTCWGLIIVNSVSSNGTGNWYVEGFPFTAASQSYSSSGVIGYNDVLTNEVNKLYMTGFQTYAQIIPNGVTQANETYSNNAITTGYFSFTITYFA